MAQALNRTLNAHVPPESEEELRKGLAEIKKEIIRLGKTIEPTKRRILELFQDQKIIEWKLENIRIVKLNKSRPKYEDIPVKKKVVKVPDVNLDDYE